MVIGVAETQPLPMKGLKRYNHEKKYSYVFFVLGSVSLSADLSLIEFMLASEGGWAFYQV